MGTSTQDRRKHSRITRHFAAKCSDNGGPEIDCVVQNFSEVGVYLKSMRAIPAGTHVHIPIKVDAKTEFEIKGVIAWSRGLSQEHSRRSRQGMGVSLSVVSQEYIDFVDKLRNLFKKGPRGIDERYEVNHRVSVRRDGVETVGYSENLSRGGLFFSAARYDPKGYCNRSKYRHPWF